MKLRKREEWHSSGKMRNTFCLITHEMTLFAYICVD